MSARLLVLCAAIVAALCAAAALYVGDTEPAPALAESDRPAAAERAEVLADLTPADPAGRVPQAGTVAELVATPASAPASDERVALAGRIAGGPCGSPGLWAAIDGGPPISISTRADGTFELVAPRGREVELHAAGDELEARLEPEVSTHAYGARDVVLTCRAPAPLVRVRFRILDAETDEPLSEAWIGLERRDGERRRGKVLGSQSGRDSSAFVPALGDVECVVRARDRRDERRLLFPSGPPPEDAEVEFVVRLERGFRREFRVLHCSEHTPVVGADLESDGGWLGRTGADGRVVVELDAWPGRLTIRAPGFEEGRWPPPWQTPVPSASVMLCPAD